MRAAAIVVMVLAGCSASDQCLATCKGCCTLEGTCRGGTANDECGVAGSECVSCGPRSCQLGVCRTSGGTGGGAGGGITGGGGGGSTGGGGGSTGDAGVDAGLVLRVFVTRSAWTGDLAAAAGVDGGFAAGDALCAAAAADAGLDRTWIAYLDGETVTLQDRLPLGQWRVVSSTSVVEHDDAGLRLTGPLNRTERGAVVPLDAGVWTGVRRTEDNLGLDCAGWQAGTSATTGTMGTTSGEEWNSLGVRSCASLGRLFCFQL